MFNSFSTAWTFLKTPSKTRRCSGWSFSTSARYRMSPTACTSPWAKTIRHGCQSRPRCASTRQTFSWTSPSPWSCPHVSLFTARALKRTGTRRTGPRGSNKVTYNFLGVNFFLRPFTRSHVLFSSKSVAEEKTWKYDVLFVAFKFCFGNTLTAEKNLI